MKKSMIAVLNFYRSWISPALPGSCRFAPTCSDYARQAIEVHGPRKGAILTIARLMRCHPFNAGGYDPVPGKAVTEHRGAGVSGKELEQMNLSPIRRYTGTSTLMIGPPAIKSDHLNREV